MSEAAEARVNPEPESAEGQSVAAAAPAPVHRGYAIYLAAVMAITIAVLYTFGRNIWCSVGDVLPWSWETSSAHNSQHLLDPYSFTHFEHGIVFYALTLVVFRGRSIAFRFVAALTLAAGWEVLENSNWIIDRYRESTVDVGYYGDSILNSLADMMWCALGFIMTARARWYWAVAVIVVFEVGLAMTIRDNLILNVIMLVHSFDAVLEWQRAR